MRIKDVTAMRVRHQVLFALSIAATTPLAVPACAQSDPSNFTTVIDLPPATIGDGEFILSHTQVNLSDGGAIGYSVRAGIPSGNALIEVNITGGMVGNSFTAYSGSEINIAGGIVGSGKVPTVCDAVKRLRVHVPCSLD
jgi:hypothetical protein